MSYQGNVPSIANSTSPPRTQLHHYTLIRYNLLLPSRYHRQITKNSMAANEEQNQAIGGVLQALITNLSNMTPEALNQLTKQIRSTTVPEAIIPVMTDAQLGPNKLSLAGSPLESIVNQTEEKFGKKVILKDHGMKQPAGDDKQAKIPRPPNAFILYRQARHPIIKAENPRFHNNDICKCGAFVQISNELTKWQPKCSVSSGKKSLQLFARCSRPKLWSARLST